MSKSIKAAALLFIMLLILSHPTDVWAHSKLTASEPAAGSDVNDVVSELVLTFNENIDPKLSSLTITNAEGQSSALSAVTVTGQEMKAVLENALPSGTYEVQWKIISADGHPIQDKYSFTVTAPEKAADSSENATEQPPAGSEASEETNSQEEAASEAAPEEESAPEDNGNAAEGEDEAQSKTSEAAEAGSSPAILIGVIVLVIVAAAGVYIVRRQARNKG
ncbi:copper resistance protein CopC [Paenibacillus sp. F411]|uniref:copper resistance CopC family protein n=1 Tax=Paenibacillus sp. F411 TaxID=2820239 RepID=UPI001AAE18AB|nr:copper resistance protein CopC [Paenibacillus sp. F411]